MQVLKNVDRDDHKICIPNSKIVSIGGVKVKLKRSAVLYIIKISFFLLFANPELYTVRRIKKMLFGFIQVSSTNKLTENTQKQSFYC